MLLPRGDRDLHARLWRLAAGDEVAVPAGQLRALLALARVHGVLGLVLPRVPIPDAELAALGGRVRHAELASSARVRRRAGDVVARLAAAGVDAMLVGGVDFADALHEDPRARPTLAVELLVARERRAAARSLVAGDAARVSCDLVEPRRGGRASVALGDLDREPGGAPTPAARLVVAAVLAALRHGFDRLFLVTDLARAARRCDDLDAARALVARTGTGAAVDAALAVAADVLADPAAERVRRELLGTRRPAVPRAVLAAVRARLRAPRGLLTPPLAGLVVRGWLRRG